jgi:glyoxylase-like metal-dependent hydrolase (beta-lactamase superfamily II)
MLEREVVAGVEKLRVCRTFFGHNFYSTAAYRIGEVLVDSGCAYTASELVRAVERSPRPRLVLNTHAHEDHIGANGPLQARFGLRILAHPATVRIMAAPRERQPEQLYRRIMWGYPEPSRGEPVGELVEAPGVRLQVIPTPGHCEDHLAFFELERGWLFCGDAFYGGKDRGLRPISDAWQMIASLRRMLALDAAVLFPGSGTVYQRPREALGEKIAYLEDLGDRIRELRRRGLSTRRIRDELFGREEAIFWITGRDFSALNLVRSFLFGATPPYASDTAATAV